MLQRLFGSQRLAVNEPSPPEAMHNQPLSFRIFSHNIRYATSSPSTNEKLWKDRFPLIMNQFFYHTRHLPMKAEVEQCAAATTRENYLTTFICLQEVLHNQFYDILGSLNNVAKSSTFSRTGKQLPEGPLWSHIGVTREDGKTEGEYSPILYPTQVFNLLHFENCWLSPTPNKPSKGWDAGSERILTSGVFEHKLTKRRLAVFNTHLDNVGTEARKRSIGIILSVIERMISDWSTNTKAGSTGASVQRLDYILTGDFNSFPSQEAYKAMLESNTVVDVHEAVPDQERYGSENTFTGFEPDTDKDQDEIGRIDFVWLGPKERVNGLRGTESSGWHVQGYSVLPNVFDDGIFCSDHRCVVTDAVLV